MKTLKKMFFLVGIISIVSLMIKCNFEKPSGLSNNGGSTSDVDGIVCGKLYEPDGILPARGASVVIRSCDYLAEIPRIGKRKVIDAQFVCRKYTDTVGYYRFTSDDSIPEGTYCIEGRDSNNNCVLIDSVMVVADSNHSLLSDTLKPSASIHGKIPLNNDSTKVVVRIFGLDTYAEAKSDGTYSIGNIPEGNLRLQFSIVVDHITSYDTIEIVTKANVSVQVADSNSLITTSIPSIGGSITRSKNAISYLPGDSVWITAHAAAGYRFSGWTGDTSILSPIDTTICVIVKKNRSINANFIKQFKLTLSDSGNGSVNPNGTIFVDSGVSWPIKAIADSGFDLKAWRVVSGQAIIEDSTAATTSVRLLNDVHILGVFKPLTFIKKFGSTLDDVGNYVLQTSDGGYIITGSTNSFGAAGSDVYLIKTNATGNEMWTKTFNGDSNDVGKSVQQTSDGGYIISGSTNSFGSGASDVYLIKTDAAGNKTWTKTFGGINDDYGNSVRQTYDGGYIIAGSTYSYDTAGSDIYIIKTDAAGNEIWTKSFDACYVDGANCVQQTSDGGYIIAASAYTAGPVALLIKTDAAGNETWINSSNVGCSSVQQTSDGGYISAGHTLSRQDPTDLLLTKTDAAGNEIWTKVFSSDGKNSDGYSVQQTKDGGYIIAGETYFSSLGVFDVYLVKTDATGNEIWSKAFGSAGNDFGYSVQQTSDGGYIIAGETSTSGIGGRDVYLIKTDENGDVK